MDVPDACIVVSLRIRDSKITGMRVQRGTDGTGGRWSGVRPSLDITSREIADLLVNAVKTETDRNRTIKIRKKKSRKKPRGFETVTGAVKRLFPKATGPDAFSEAKRRVLEGKLIKGQEKIEELLLSGLTPEEVLEELDLPWYFTNTVREIKRYLKKEKKRTGAEMIAETNIKALLEEKRRHTDSIRETLPFNYRDKLLCPRVEDKVLCLRYPGNDQEKGRIVSYRKDCKVCVHWIVGEDGFVICKPEAGYGRGSKN